MLSSKKYCVYGRALYYVINNYITVSEVTIKKLWTSIELNMQIYIPISNYYNIDRPWY